MTRVLFVDDDDFMLSAMRRLMRHSGWNVRFVNGGHAALDELANWQPHAIVSDMRMPGMSGLELLSRVRDEYPTISRVVLSGQTDVQPELHSDVAHVWLPKPCDPKILRQSIVELCVRCGPEAEVPE